MFSGIVFIVKKVEEYPINIVYVLENCFDEISKVTEMEYVIFRQKFAATFSISLAFTTAVSTNWLSILFTNCVQRPKLIFTS